MFTKIDKEHNKETKRISPHVTAFIGAIITLIGGFFLSYNYVQAKKIVAFDYMANAFYNGNEVVQITEEEETNKPIEEEKLPDEVTNEYIGYLNIPKINLTKGFLDMRSTENDVEKNILVVTYKNKKYNYKIVNIYKQPKTGVLAIYRNYDKTTLTLITCTNNDSKSQTVYIAELESVE